jgi:hypothetical protein
MEGENTPMASIRNGLKFSQFGILACSALALCLAPLASNAQSAEKAEATSESAEAEAQDAAVAAVDAFIAEQNVDKAQPNWKRKLEKPPKVSFTAGKSYFWNLETNKGAIKIKLMPDTAPMHVSSAIYLTRLGFYDGTIFHRVIPRFMAQGGDPTGTGRGCSARPIRDRGPTVASFSSPSSRRLISTESTRSTARSSKAWTRSKRSRRPAVRVVRRKRNSCS